MYLNRESILVTANNYALVTAGTKLYNADGSINILPGQLGIYDAANHTALGTAVSKNKVYFAVGVDTNGDGIADTIRKSAGEELVKCKFDSATAEPPRGECPEIWDFMFDCTTCEAEYGIQVKVDSPEFAPFFADEMYPTYPFNITTDCCGCELCTTEHNCNEVVCKFVDAINQTTNNGPSKNTIKKDLPFVAERLFANVYTIQLPCIDGNCGKTYLEALESITINGVTTPITIADPNNANQMLIGQIKLLENQLNTILTQGTVRIYQKCSDTCYEIMINTCDTVTAVAGKVTPSLPVVVTHPLTVTTETNCTDCEDAGTTTKTYPCGIRLISKMFPVDCGCFPPKRYIGTRYTKLGVYPTTGFSCNNFKTNQVQTVTLSEGKGVDLRWREFMQETGGAGRNYDPYVQSFGKFGVHSERMSSSILSQCIDYCVYSLRHHSSSNPEAPLGPTYNSILQTTLIIPSTDSTTMEQFETAFNGWNATTTCPLGPINCWNATTDVLVDKDQTVGENNPLQ